jgi:Protein of unknown function (DUF3450)
MSPTLSTPVVVFVAACLLMPGVVSAQQPNKKPGDQPDPASARERVETTRAVLGKLVEIRGMIETTRREWAVDKEMLKDRIDVVKRAIESLRERIADAETSITEADKKRADLAAQSERLKKASAALADAVTPLETRTRQLLRRLPEPICEQVKPLSQRIPADPTQSKVSLGERFMNIVGLLNAVNKFNRQIIVTSELRKLADGATAEVATLYVGIGQAYYVSAKGDAAGFGTATEEGWVWTPDKHAAPNIATAIAILQNEQPAGFVQLPIKIRP